MKYLLRFCFLWALLLAGAVSCNDRNLGAEYAGADGFAFDGSVAYVEVGPEDEGRILIPVHRSGFGINNADVSFETECPKGYEDPSGLFSLLTPMVIFPDGQLTTNVQVRISDLGKLSLVGKYCFKLKILDDLSPSNRGELSVTVSRRLTFRPCGKATFFDQCLFDNAYEVDIWRAEETEAYRVMDPYRPGLIAEEYAADGWMANPPEYIQFRVDGQGLITYDPFQTGMLVYGVYLAWACHPSVYTGADFSAYSAENKRLSETEFQLYPVYYLPEVHDGYLNEGVYPLLIKLL